MSKEIDTASTHHVHPVIRGRRLFDFESALKPLPVADLAQSVHVFAAALQPLLTTPEEAQEVQRLVADFLSPDSPAHALHGMLLERARKMGPHTDYPNCSWLEGWWDKYAYLSWQEPLPINVNFFGTVITPQSPRMPQLLLAAIAVHHFLRFERLVSSGDLPPDSLDAQGAHPLSSFQYTRVFSCARLPSATCDTIASFPGSTHVAVASNGFWYRLNVADPSGNPLSPAELLRGLLGIEAHSKGLQSAATQAQPVGLLTTQHRKVWAEQREALLRDARYARGIHAIESALFNVSLSGQSPEGDRALMRAAELGDPERGDYWFDKSSTLFVYKNGTMGFGGEHAHADAPVPARGIHYLGIELCRDVALNQDMMKVYQELLNNNSNSSSSISSSSSSSSFEWLNFEPSTMLSSYLSTAHSGFLSAIAQSETEVLCHSGVNKALLKALRVSPDSFFQMAMQLAYFRDQGAHTATYETASTRSFFHGRTETIRPMSQESARWVESMLNYGTMDNSHDVQQQRMELLRKAMHSHTSFVRNASFGKGCDRVLFGLKIAALESGTPVPPLLASPLFNRGNDFGLSTSNMSNSAAGVPGFGAPSPSSYGVCYNMGNRDLKACVTSCKADEKKSAARFLGAITQAIDDMLDLYRTLNPSAFPQSSL